MCPPLIQMSARHLDAADELVASARFAFDVPADVEARQRAGRIASRQFGVGGSALLRLTHRIVAVRVAFDERRIGRWWPRVPMPLGFNGLASRPQCALRFWSYGAGSGSFVSLKRASAPPVHSKYSTTTVCSPSGNAMSAE
jgi:hypothetical protein